MRVLYATLVCALMVPGSGAAQDGIQGEWVGAYEVGNEFAFVRVQFKREAEDLRAVVISMTPGPPRTIGDVRVGSSYVSFELTDTEKLRFRGQLHGNVFAGTVEKAEQRGKFQFARTFSVNPKLYDQYAGAYDLGQDGLIFIRRSDLLEHDPPYSVTRSWLYYTDESGRMGMLYPSSDSAFFSGPTYAVPLPVELEVSFVRSEDGQITGLKWRKGGGPERFAPRSRLYREEPVYFRNGDITLAGTLLVPSRKGPHPAVVITLGRAANNRNTGIALADIFARKGIAALVWDKRGVGGSTGDWRQSSFLGSLADDALAAASYLRSREDINSKQVGLLGSSWTSVVASLAASRSRDAAFLIILSPPGLSLGDRYLMGLERGLRANGYPQEEIAEALAFARLEVEFSRTGKGLKELQAAASTLRTRKWFSRTWSVTFGAPSREHPDWVELRKSAVDDHPELLLKEVACPVLAIYGESDTLVPPADNKRLIEKGLRDGGNKDYTVTILPKGDHGLWQVEPNGPAAAKTYAPGFFKVMTDWLAERVAISQKE